ncbi:MAG: GNAT family N-acetyltransferase [Nitrosomonadales bacterium]|nr:GNAT family N-acetyltransferase [Nitrosomonadales bacterium]
MRHDISIEGSIFRLRPIADADASLVVELRNNSELNRFLHASSDKVEDQLAWLAKYYQREGDYYFVIERCSDGAREGVIALYDIDPNKSAGEWGRWILKPGSLAAVESAFLIYRVAFDLLGLEGAYCRTVADNSKVVSFHDSCGISDRKLLPGHFELESGSHDAIEHRVDRSSWDGLRPRLENLVRLTAKRMSRA